MSKDLLPVAILAGGLATRLGDHAGGVPKAIIDIGGEPFLGLVLRLLAGEGVEHAVVCVGHGAEHVRAALGDGSAFGVSLEYVDDGPRPLGTGGAARLAAEQIDGPFFVLNGDSYLPCRYRAVQSAFETAGKPALMVVFRNHDRWDRSNVCFEDGRVVAYDKWHPDQAMDCIDYGLGVLTREALADVDPGEPADLGRLMQGLIDRGQLAGYEVFDRFYEVGSPTGLDEFRRLMGARRDG